jgi:formylglycine-generating enzyme required for sulfatase activity
MLLLCAMLLAAAPPGNGSGSPSSTTLLGVAGGAVAVPGGRFAPLYGLERTQSSLPVSPFRAAVRAVTTAQFRAFLAVSPRWRSPSPALADERYLQSLDGPADAPMVNVSWFAARAFCAWAGGRLPTTLEWEYLAAADEHTADASRDPAFVQRILEWYSKPIAPAGQGRGSPRNVYGAEALHGLIWEWTEDFNSSFLTTDNRADGDKNASLLCGSGSIGSARREDYAAFMRYAFRSSLTARTSLPSLGFRCAFEVSP